MSVEAVERVAMLWPTALKQRVRDLVGTRGLTAFVIAAVEERLAGAVEEELTVAAVVRVDEPTPSVDEPAVFAEEAASATDGVMEDADGPQEEEADDTVAVDDVITPVDSTPANFDRSTQAERTQLIQDRFSLQRASDLPPVAPTAEGQSIDEQGEEDIETTLFCSACSAPLIDGECWACAM